MHRRKYLALALFAHGLAFGASTWCVAPNGNDAASGSDWASALATIQAAVAKAASGDAVVISNGVYLLDAPIVVPADKVLNIRSFENKSETVVIDGQQMTHCFVFLRAGSNSLSALTIRNGAGSAYIAGNSTIYPGGVYAAAGSLTSLVISNCHSRVTGATTAVTCNGGAIYQSSGISSHLTVIDCGIEVETSANALGQCAGGGIFTTGIVQDSVFSNCSVVVTAPNFTGDTEWMISSGGIYSGSANVHQRNRVYDSRAILESASGSAGIGGGVYLMGSGDKLKDSLVTGCVASRCGGGVAIRASGAVENCTISNNTVAVRKQIGGGVGGAGVYFDSHVTGAKVIDGCEIVGNVMSNLAGTTGWQDCGGGGAVVRGSTVAYPAIVRNSVFRDNSAWCYGGGIYFYSGGLGEGATVVTNCWFSRNRATNRGGFAYVTVSAGGLVADCRFDGHSSGNQGNFLVRHSDGGVADNDFTVRNSFITGNNPEGNGNYIVWLYKGAAGHSPLVFEQCTFAANGRNGYGGTLFDMQANTNPLATVCSNFFCRGCAIAGNNGMNLFNTSLMDSITNMFTSSYTDSTGNLATGGNDVRKNLYPAIAPNPGFANAAEGDWRLASGSPLIDAGGAAKAWMGNGSKRGPYDMGDGTFTVSRAEGTTFGVTLVRNSPLARQRGDGPDMGCFERYQPRIFTISVK